MGWKTLKERFDIRHTVQITSAGICIGSSYVHDIGTIDPETGRITDRRTTPGFLRTRYPDLMNATPEEILDLLKTPDTFSRSVTVYTYEGGAIVEKQCEEPGWPNVTHDGIMMYDNTFSTNKEKVVEWAKRNAGYVIKALNANIASKEEELADLRRRLACHEADQAKLVADYPSV